VCAAGCCWEGRIGLGAGSPAGERAASAGIGARNFRAAARLRVQDSCAPFVHGDLSGALCIGLRGQFQLSSLQTFPGAERFFKTAIRKSLSEFFPVIPLFSCSSRGRALLPFLQFHVVERFFSFSLRCF